MPCAALSAATMRHPGSLPRVRRAPATMTFLPEPPPHRERGLFQLPQRMPREHFLHPWDEITLHQSRSEEASRTVGGGSFDPPARIVRTPRPCSEETLPPDRVTWSAC